MAEKPPKSVNPEAFLKRAGKGMTIKTYGPGQPVFQQGDAATALFYIQAGTVKMSCATGLGREVVIALHNPMEFFGEGAIAGQKTRISTAVSHSESVIARIETSTVIGLIHYEPVFAEVLIAHLLGRAMRSETDLIDLLSNSSEKKLARLLLLLSSYGKDQSGEAVIAEISHETLAQMIDTTAACINYFMNKFDQMGFISRNGGIEVHAARLNTVLHGAPRSAQYRPKSTRNLQDDQSGSVVPFRPI